jgi:hypothetical protein
MASTNKFNGTSAATPHVAGAAALVKGRVPCLHARQVQTFLEGRAVDMGPGWQGHGLRPWPAVPGRAALDDRDCDAYSDGDWHSHTYGHADSHTDNHPYG